MPAPHRSTTLSDSSQPFVPSPPVWSLALLLVGVSLLCLPRQFTVFSVPKEALAWWGVWLLLVLHAGARLPAPPQRLPWMVFLSWAALSLLWSPAGGRGEASASTWFLLFFWCMLLHLLQKHIQSTRNAAQRERALLLLLGAVTLLMVLNAAVGILQQLGFWRMGVHRITGAIGNPNRLAGVLLLCLPAAGWLCWTQKGALRALGVLGACAGLVTMWLTSCRSAWLGLLVASLALCGAWAHKRLSPPRQLVLGLLVALALGWGGWALVAKGAGKSFSGRLRIQRVAWQVLQTRPIHGVGLGGFAKRAAWAQGKLLTKKPAAWTNLRDPHNQLSAIATELGLVGLVLFLWLLASYLVPCLRGRDNPLNVAALFAWTSLGVHSLAETPALSVTTGMLAALWLVLAATSDPQDAQAQEAPTEAPETAPPTLRRWATQATLLTVALLCTWGVLRASQHMYADWLLGKGRQLAARGQRDATKEAVALYSRGLRHALTKDDLWFARGLALRELGQSNAASDDLKRAFAAMPGPDSALAIGDIANARQDLSSAIAWYRKAIQLHPRYARAYNNLGVAYLRAKQLLHAQRFLQRARSLRPGDPSIQRNWRLLQRSLRKP